MSSLSGHTCPSLIRGHASQAQAAAAAAVSPHFSPRSRVLLREVRLLVEAHLRNTWKLRVLVFSSSRDTVRHLCGLMEDDPLVSHPPLWPGES